MGLFGLFKGVIRTGKNVVITPIAVVDDVLEGDITLSSTRNQVGNTLDSALETIDNVLDIEED